MAGDLTAALEYVQSVDLTGTPRGLIAQGATSDAGDVFQAAKNQAQVVGSGLFSFSKGVTTEMRDAISDCALLAQLVANKQFKLEQAPKDWYGAYQEVLEKAGWVLQDAGWTDYTADGNAAEVNEKIIEVISAALQPTAAALTILKAAIDVLQKMQPGTSWFTIFNRESADANMARVQVGLVEPGENDDLFVSLLACLIEARTNVTQVLFFRYRSEHAKFEANSSKVSINRGALEYIAPAMKAKVRDYQADYVSSIQNLAL